MMTDENSVAEDVQMCLAHGSGVAVSYRPIMDEDGGLEGCPVCRVAAEHIDYVATLMDQLTKQAIIVTDGNVTITTPGPIGLLQVHGGTVTIGGGQAIEAIKP